MNKTIIWTGGALLLRCRLYFAKALLTESSTPSLAIGFAPICSAIRRLGPVYPMPVHACACRPNDGPRLSEVSPLHATLNCGYRHHGCMCRSCVSQLIRRNPFLRQYVASLTGRMLMVAGRDMLIPGRLASPPSRAETGERGFIPSSHPAPLHRYRASF